MHLTRAAPSSAGWADFKDLTQVQLVSCYVKVFVCFGAMENAGLVD